jgi:hypothetical protein
MRAGVARTIVLCLLVASAPAATALSFAGLQQLIADRDVRSIEALLPLLPADLRSRYVLMFRSRSLHGSSFSHPRAILFDPEARFVISFNGDASQAGFNALETMEFDEATRSFAFREITFPSEARSAKEAVHASQANPELCLKCHGDPARPIWDTHPVWPGAYGERYNAALTASEQAGLRNFLRQQPAHPRYRYLLEVDRFANLETFRPSARTRYEGSESLPPNGEFGAALGRLNFEAIVHELESAPQFDSHKYLLLAALGTDCGRLEAFYPDAGRASIGSALERFTAASARANSVQAELKKLRASDPAGYRGSVESLDRFRFVVETAFGLSTAQWTTALEKGSYDFAWSASAPAEMSSYLRKRVAQTSPEINDLAGFRTFSERDPYCAYLERRSRAVLAAARATAIAATSSSAVVPMSGAARIPALLQQCAGCHLGGVGPHLPFDHPPELAALLRGGRFAHGTLMDEIRWRLAPQAGAGRMPLGTNISDEERDALVQHFAALSQDATPP